MNIGRAASLLAAAVVVSAAGCKLFEKQTRESTSPDKKDGASANTPSVSTGMPANTQALSDSEKCFDTSSLT
ncbi:MAG TPA: hypothetical protein VEU33_45780, partial [Archangium sp.]|nr:hypothetical protein [Archangium sp.]